MYDLQREQYALTRLRWEYNMYIEKQVELNNKVVVIQTLEYQIAYKRFIEGKILNEIADELGYEYSYMKKKSMETDKMIK